MRPMSFRCAVLLSLVLVTAPDALPVFEATTADAQVGGAQRRPAPRRRRPAVSRYQTSRSRNARNVQQRRLQTQRLAQLNRSRSLAAQRSRMNAFRRPNPYAFQRPNPYAMNQNRFLPGAYPGMPNPAYTPVLVYKDYRVQFGENVSVSSLTPLGRKATIEDVAVGQTVTVTIVKEVDSDTPSKTPTTPGQLTGQVVKSESNSATQELTVRVSSYQYGAQAGNTTTIPPVPGQSVSAVLIRSKAQGAAGLFNKQ
ncbi:MAG: hypothetical protein K2R98_13625 [Gemmataceae bacterium]|nr:hypothetical protein [Gemmataceae bacterium]